MTGAARWRLAFAMGLAATLGVAGCTTAAQRNVVVGISKEQLGIAILGVNLLDIYNLPYSADGADWKTRYARIGTWIQTTRNIPDVIALQEAPGWWRCGDTQVLHDYEGLDFLVERIRQATGEQYRIAYLIPGKPGGTQNEGWVVQRSAGGCQQQSGRALLYRSSRLRNAVVAPRPGDIVATPYTPYPMYTPFLARSLPCCPTVAGASNVCGLIDGELSTVVNDAGQASCATPAGVAWTRARVSGQGADPGKPQLDAVFSRFELRNQPGAYVHVYNLHRGLGTDPKDDRFPQQVFGVFGIDQLVSHLESLYRGSADTPLYPPILVGDFNLGEATHPPTPEEVKQNFFRFEQAMWGPENMGAVFGLPGAFPAKQSAYANNPLVIPETPVGQTCYRDPATLWSDHCGIYFRVEPAR